MMAVAVAFLAVFVVDYGGVADKFRAIGFEPSREMRGLMKDIAVTSRADLILWATHPTLKDQTDFNEACRSHNPEIAVMGCFTGERIFVYNVENEELAGIKQSTLAHELLHAAWERLSEPERQDLMAQLLAIYERQGGDLVARMERYPRESFYDELHSIVGTEISVAELDATCVNFEVCKNGGLRVHYARYFENPERVIGFFEAYNERFLELKAAADRLYAKITSQREEIEAKTTNYEDGMAGLNAEIDDFNRRVAGEYFANREAAELERSGLLVRQDALGRMYDDLAALVADTNRLIEEYNRNVARTQFLVDSINSNAQRSGAEVKN